MAGAGRGWSIRGRLADRQREFARRAASVHELDAGRHPFLSRPAELRDPIVGLIAGAR